MLFLLKSVEKELVQSMAAEGLGHSQSVRVAGTLSLMVWDLLALLGVEHFEESRRFLV